MLGDPFSPSIAEKRTIAGVFLARVAQEVGCGEIGDQTRERKPVRSPTKVYRHGIVAIIR